MKKLITLSCLVLFAFAAHAQKSGDYRSVKSGNWTDFANVWQKYNGSKWVAATNYPTSSNGIITISDTTNVTINLNLTTDQTVVEGGGVLTLSANYTVTLAGSNDALTINGAMNWTSGTFASTGRIKVQGTLLWGGGNLQTQLVNNGTISITGNVSAYSTLTNNGTINWYSNYITYQTGTITNNGVFNVYSNGIMNNGNGGTFTNTGTGVFNQLNGNTTMQTEITFNNKGVMNLNSGVFLVTAGAFTNTKKMVFSGGKFQNQATSNFNTGTAVSGTGNITEAYNTLNINLALALPSGITFSITNSGTVAGSGSLKIPGIMYWDAGSLNLDLTVQGTGIIYISNGNVTLYSTITNNGTINWSGAYLSFNGGTILNNKKFNAYSNGYLNNSGGGTFTNKAGATFTRQVGNGNIVNEIIFNNAGTMNINTGEFYNSGTFTNTSVLAFNGGNFENAATANFNTGTSVTGKGSILASYNTVNMNTAVTLPANVALYINNSATVSGTGSLKITGNMYWYSGSVNTPLTIQSTGILNIGAGNVSLYSALTNNGTVNWTNGHIYFYGGSIINNKAFNVFCDQNLNKGTSGTFTNNAAGTVTKQSLGTTTVAIPFNNSGTIQGVGNFAFATNLTNSGVFAPGINNATGILTTGTDYKNKTLTIKMNNAVAGLGFDRLLVNGNVTLGNDTLRVIASDTMPAGSYTVLKWTGQRSGTIKVKDLPDGYTVSYQANKVVVNVPAAFSKNNSVAETDDALKSTIENKVFSVFPNPASNTININYKLKSRSATIQIFNADGKQVAQRVITGESNSNIDVSNLAAGTYILQIKDGAVTQSAKFIKQ